MLPKNLKEVTWDHIEALVTNGVSEGKDIEFKQELPGRAEKDKNEFLADVTAFANAGGGHIIYGIRDEEGIAKEIVGLTDNLDEAKLFLNNIARDCVEPRLHVMPMETVSSSLGRKVVVIHIPMSWFGPHRIKANSRFYVRNSAGKHPMDISELRSAFAMSETTEEKIRRFRDDRLGKIMANETPIPLENVAKLILHVVPMASFHMDTELDIDKIANSDTQFYPLGRSGGNNRYNMDGFLMVALRETSYCQVFRRGQIEGVTAGLSGDVDGMKTIPCFRWEDDLLKATSRYIDGLEKLGLPYPMIVMVSVLGIRGYQIPKDVYDFDCGSPVDRETLLLPDILIKEHSDDFRPAFRPLFDALWNASGFPRSRSYNEQGEWAR